MATITLYKEKVNGVGGLIDNLIKSSSNLDVQLGTLKNTLQGVDSSTCNLQDTVDSISSSSKSEKSKIEDLKKLNNKLSEFIETASRKDSAADATAPTARLPPVRRAVRRSGLAGLASDNSASRIPRQKTAGRIRKSLAPAPVP